MKNVQIWSASMKSSGATDSVRSRDVLKPKPRVAFKTCDTGWRHTAGKYTISSFVFLFYDFGSVTVRMDSIAERFVRRQVCERRDSAAVVFSTERSVRSLLHSRGQSITTPPNAREKIAEIVSIKSQK